MATLTKLICLAVLVHLSSQVPDPIFVRPEDLTAITLMRDKMTTARRASPIPQLQCISGSCRQTINTVQCYNRGLDGNDIQWECKTSDLDSDYGLVVETVNCESYPEAHSRDILVGSCGLRYSISGGVSDGTYWGLVALFFIIVLVLSIFGVVCCCMVASSAQNVVHTGGYRPSYYGPSYGGYGGYGGYYGGGYYGNNGFGTGMMTGYMMGSNRGYCGSGYGGGGFGSRSFGGGGGGGGGFRSSSGFGGTTRR